MPWTRLSPAAVIQQLRAEHGPGDEDIAEQALAHLREALLNGVYIMVKDSASGRTFCWRRRESA